jgi:mono/diheme cytochrome c family protein
MPLIPLRFLSGVVALAAGITPAAADVRNDVLARTPALKEIVFAVRKPNPGDPHWYANFSYYGPDENRAAYQPGGRLCKLDLVSGVVTNLIDDPQGGIRDPVLNADATRILFAWRKGKDPYYHLHDCRLDGSDVRQLTDGPWDDFEPSHLPDGGIVFVSSRCKRWVNCWLTQVATLHRCDADGRHIELLSANLEQDNTPWPLPDGRILYQRWEYIDRSQVHYHHLWTTNPDGTNQMVYYGNQTPGIVMIDAKPIPGADQVVSIFSPDHGQLEHAGRVVTLSPRLGPDDKAAAHVLSPAANFRDPWPLASDAFVVARTHEILAMDGKGETAALFTLSEADRQAGFWVHEPRPVLPRALGKVISSHTDQTKATGKLILSNILEGRNMQGVKPGEIRKLLVLEPLPKPINYTGGMDPLTYGGSFTLERVVGTVPVEADGSAYLELPARRSFFFVALDANDLAVKRMQSFLTVQPGEVTSCIGCHEQRSQTSLAPLNLKALQRPPSPITPVPGVPGVFDYPRDIQPILDTACGDCHGYDKTARGGPYAGKLILTGDRGPMFSHSYFMMTVAGLFSDGRNRSKSNYPPRTLGSSASRLLKLSDGSHYGATVTPQQATLLRLWIDAAATYPGTYAALGTGMIGGYQENRQVHTDGDWPSTAAAGEVINTRCAACHTGNGPSPLPRSLSDERGTSFWKPKIPDRTLITSRHLVFNLSRPQKSLILLAPLARAAGGYQLCRKGDDSTPVFSNTSDPGYQALLAMVSAGKQDLETITRFDMPNFKPRAAYVREMKRFGILPADLPAAATVDPYQTDQLYWQSLWYQPPAGR